MLSANKKRVSLALLVGFEAAARTLSFTKAAKEISVTQSAISRQIKSLEDQLGKALFRRINRGLTLTAEGEMLFNAVSSALKLIINTVESSELAAQVLQDICNREGIVPGQVILHSDNGAPMRGATLLATLQMLGVEPSFSRPAVSNDNPYSEALFKTLKYHPIYPQKPFANLLAARLWVGQFVTWYNQEHRHSAVRFVTPSQRHDGLDHAILAKRVEVYEAAKLSNPNRWSGPTRNWQRITEVHLNPDKQTQHQIEPKEVRSTLKKAA